MVRVFFYEGPHDGLTGNTNIQPILEDKVCKKGGGGVHLRRKTVRRPRLNKGCQQSRRRW